MDTTEAAPTAGPGGRRNLALSRAARELALVAALFLAYKIGRVAAAGREPTAVLNGERVWRWERLLHLPAEAALQQPLLAHELLVRLTNTYYAYVHFPATALCLVWLYVRRPAHYRWARRMLATLTAAALVLHFLLPLAPPRLTGRTGMIDTASRFGPAVYGAPEADTVSNQYAAMPSLHVGWALVVAVVLVRVTAGRLRWLWLTHPLATLLVVVGTGNHYWLDCLVAAALLGVILAVLPGPDSDGRTDGAAVPPGMARTGRHVPPRGRRGLPGASVPIDRTRPAGRWQRTTRR
ncbi:phosphatase PAP2 family protein [Micromonospora sp. DR5-3]|uniref:phosphatase PAP2 family protein n=1 Tax=unclassified Micromonospora TaxID=2617518 RepID=UPI0011D71A1C|nr:MULTISPECIES: phosphatase PAP2 family protein [unclassified Micromonospora]MCW3816128.1 phosphatase PAP2 family protein [Micromonospora sp. DR5-3]TYC22143.1 inositol phosphorylceramide synthase [Micromonospora sp. MP36]